MKESIECSPVKPKMKENIEFSKTVSFSKYVDENNEQTKKKPRNIERRNIDLEALTELENRLEELISMTQN